MNGRSNLLPHRVVLIAVGTMHCVMLGWMATRHSPTYDEIYHLVAGLTHLRDGHFNLATSGPPLVRTLAAIIPSVDPTVILPPYDSTLRRADWPLGRAFVAANQARCFPLVTIARWTCIPLSLIGAFTCYAWGRDLWGRPSGMFAFTLWCVSPNIIAHAELITSDIGATSLSVLSCYWLWKWDTTKRPVSYYTAGILLGLAQLTKYTCLFLYPLFAIFVAFHYCRCTCSFRIGRFLCSMALLVSISLYVLNLGYCFERTGHSLAEIPHVSHRLISGLRSRELPSVMGSIPIPLPAVYVSGLCPVLHTTNARTAGYVAGEFKPGGRWYYYLYAISVKVPEGTLTLFVIATVCGIVSIVRGRLSCVAALYLLLPICVLLCVASGRTSMNKHMRYILPIAPFAYIWVSHLVSNTGRRVSLSLQDLHRILDCRGIVSAAAIFLLAWTATSSLTRLPHALSYFNSVSGGPLAGIRHLSSSNIDWGQDLLNLRSWLDEHPEVSNLRLAYYGFIDPTVAGIKYSLPPIRPTTETAAREAIALEPGWYVVSVNYLQGYTFRLYDGRGNRPHVPANAFSYFQQFKPVDRIGYSMYVFRILSSTAGRH